MDDPPVPSISTGSVGSRFVTSSELEQAKATRDAAWKAAYARLGQEAPPPPVDEGVQDGRSLFEKLQTNKMAKEEQWQEQHKLSKQFRALEEDEIRFLDQIRQKKAEEERARKAEESVELQGFRSAVAQRTTLGPPPLPVPGSGSVPATASSSSPSKPTTTTAPTKPPPAGKAKLAAGKKDQKTLLKGVVVRKKDKERAGAGTGTAGEQPSPAGAIARQETVAEVEKGEKNGNGNAQPGTDNREQEETGTAEPDAKRRKLG